MGNINRFMKKQLASLFILISTTLFSQEPTRILGSSFPYSLKPDSLFIINDSNFSEEEVLIIQTIQGITSKSQPKLYRDVGTGSSVWLNHLIENELITPNYTFNSDFEGVISRFSEYISGYVWCDLHTTSSNIAISLCGLLNAIPVTGNHLNLMDSLNIPLLYDVRDKDYNWALNTFENLFGKNIVVYQDTVKDLCLGDYSVFTNSFHFYDDIHSDLVNTVFEKMEKNSFLFGWGSDEYQTVNKSSSYSISVLPSDYAYNLSVLTNFDVSLSQKNHEIETTTIDSTHTICFLMSDGDNIQWLLNWFITDERWFGSLNRGYVDIGWTISPALSELAPTAMSKIFESAANNIDGKDYFVAGPSGTGYIYPDSYKDLEDYTTQLDRYMQKSDLNIVNIIGNNFDDSYLYSFLDKPNINGLFYYDFSDYSAHKGEIKFLNNKPVISARYNLWGGFEHVKSLSSKINSLPKDPFSSSGYSLIPVHNWSNSVDSILLCREFLDENVKIVSPDKFVNLIKKNLLINNNEVIFRNYPNPTSDIITVELYVEHESVKSFNLYDTNGIKQNISDFKLISISENLVKLEIGISNLKSGVYFLRIHLSDKNTVLFKIIKQ